LPQHPTVGYLAEHKGLLVELFDPSMPGDLQRAMSATAKRLGRTRKLDHTRPERARIAARLFSVDRALSLVLRRASVLAGEREARL
jgi:hypothetical protein